MATSPVEKRITKGPRSIPLLAGALLSLSFSTWFKLFPTVIVTMVMFAIPFLILNVYVPAYFQKVSDDPERGVLISLLAIFVPMCLNVASNQIYVGAIAYGAVESLRGARCTPTDSVRVAFKRLLPLLGSAILVALIVLGGFVMLVVPGFFALAALAVTAPAVVCENRGVIDSLKRSAELTKGRRGTVFGAIFLMGLVTGIIGALIGVAAAIALSGSVDSKAFQYIVTVFSMVVGSVASVLYAVIYFALRQRKDGVEIDEIAKVFE